MAGVKARWTSAWVAYLMFAVLVSSCGTGIPPGAKTQDPPTPGGVLDLAEAEETCAGLLTPNLTPFHVSAGEGFQFRPAAITENGRVIGTKVRFGSEPRTSWEQPMTTFGLWLSDPTAGTLSWRGLP